MIYIAWFLTVISSFVLGYFIGIVVLAKSNLKEILREEVIPNFLRKLEGLAKIDNDTFVRRIKKIYGVKEDQQ